MASMGPTAIVRVLCSKSARLPGVVVTDTSDDGRHSSRRRRDSSTRHRVSVTAPRL